MKNNLIALAIACTVTVTTPCFAATLLNEDFNDGLAQGWEMLDGSPAITNGTLGLVSLGFGNDVRAVYRESSWSNYVLEVDMLIQDAGSSPWPASILFHVVEASGGLDNGQYYQIALGPAHLSFSKISGGGSQGYTTVTTNDAMTVGQWHHVRIEIEGTTATAFIDGQQVLTYAGFTDFRSGGVGLKAINSAQILYDNILVSGPFQPTLAIRCSQVQLSWDTLTNKTYQLQYRSTLTTNLWTDLGSPVAGTGGRLTFKDDILEGMAQRFYQIVQTP